MDQHPTQSLFDRFDDVRELLVAGSFHGGELTSFRIAPDLERSFSHFDLLNLAFWEEMGGFHRPPPS